MPFCSTKPAPWLWLACAAAVLVLDACASASPAPAPTIDVGAIQTAGIQTFSAEVATQLALTPPTPAPPPTQTVTPPASTSAASGLNPGGQAACDSATYLADVTIPDGTVIDPGADFLKTWVLQNTGSCAWTTAYKLTFASGDRMGGADVSVQAPVQPGGRLTVSVNLVAPTSAGAYKGVWRMQNDKGQAFGDSPYVQISVGTVSTCRGPARARVTISGRAGPENVTINYGDGTTTTDNKGNYSFTVQSGWSGTVTPSKAKVHPWTFDPPFRTYSNVTCDLPNEDYHATAPPGV